MQEGAGSLLLLAAAHETGLLSTLTTALPCASPTTPPRLARMLATTVRALLLTLLALTAVGQRSTWDLRSYTGTTLALLTGRLWAYGYRHVERFLVDLARSGGADRLTDALAEWTARLWVPPASAAAAPIRTYSIDGHRKPVYTEDRIPRGLIGRSGARDGCRALVLLHGYAKTAVEHSEVAKQRAALSQRRDTLVRWTEGARERGRRASARYHKRSQHLKARGEELYRALNAHISKLSRQGVGSEICRIQSKAMQRLADDELLQDVKLSGSGLRGKVTIVAEGMIDIGGSAQRFTAYAGNLLFFSNQTNPSKAAITLSGSKSTLLGIIYAPGGAIVLPGLSNTLFGSLVGTSVTLNGSSLIITCSRLPDANEEPPPVIIVHDDDIVREIENINGVIFVNISITILNTGGDARGVFLVLTRADFAELFDLADVSFLESIGFVSSVDAEHVMIGLGQNNKIHHNEKVKIKLKFKLRSQITVDIRFSTRFTLIFGGTGGTREVPLPPIVVIVPVVLVPGTTPAGSTPVITPTTAITPTTSVTPTVIVVPRLPLSAIDVRFVSFWRGQGGLDIFGLPISQPITLPSGIVVQYFERARLEFHPEHRGTRYAVLLGLLGVELGYSAPNTATTAPTATAELAWYFPATRHLVAKPFRSFWQNRGGLLIFGLPVGEAHLEDGRLVQYFERARFELHPDLAGTPYEVQLGHLGVLALQANDQR